MNLKRQVFSGIRWTTLSSLGRAVLQFMQIVILAHLLTPAEFGLIAVVVAIMSFLQIFADAGISNAIIHHQDISQDQLSSLYWLNVGASTILAITIISTSPLVAAWYNQPELCYLLMLAGPALVLGSLAQQIRLIAQKNLQFANLAKIELISATAGFIAAVSTALLGCGVYSVSIGNITSAAMGALLIWAWLAEGWRPCMMLKLDEIRLFLKFGAYMIGNNLVNTFNSQIDILLGGKLLGPQALGMYSLPKDLNFRIAGVINPIVTQVALPVMAKAQNDHTLLKNIYLQSIRMTASVNFPIYIFVGLFAHDVVQLMFGVKWYLTIPLLQVFSIWALVRSTGNPVGSLLMACGRADLSFKWNLGWLIIMPPIIWLSSQHGVLGMALAMMGLSAVGFWPNWYFLVRPLCGAKFGEYVMQMGTPLFLSLIAGLIGYTFGMCFAVPAIRLIAGALICILSYLALSYLFNNKWFQAICELLGYCSHQKVN